MASASTSRNTTNEIQDLVVQEDNIVGIMNEIIPESHSENFGRLLAIFDNPHITQPNDVSSSDACTNPESASFCSVGEAPATDGKTGAPSAIREAVAEKPISSSPHSIREVTLEDTDNPTPEPVCESVSEEHDRPAPKYVCEAAPKDPSSSALNSIAEAPIATSNSAAPRSTEDAPADSPKRAAPRSSGDAPTAIPECAAPRPAGEAPEETPESAGVPPIALSRLRSLGRFLPSKVRKWGRKLQLCMRSKLCTKGKTDSKVPRDTAAKTHPQPTSLTKAASDQTDLQKQGTEGPGPKSSCRNSKPGVGVVAQLEKGNKGSPSELSGAPRQDTDVDITADISPCFVNKTLRDSSGLETKKNLKFVSPTDIPEAPTSSSSSSVGVQEALSLTRHGSGLSEEEGDGAVSATRKQSPPPPSSSSSPSPTSSTSLAAFRHVFSISSTVSDGSLDEAALNIWHDDGIASPLDMVTRSIRFCAAAAAIEHLFPQPPAGQSSASYGITYFEASASSSTRGSS